MLGDRQKRTMETLTITRIKIGDDYNCTGNIPQYNIPTEELFSKPRAKMPIK